MLKNALLYLITVIIWGTGWLAIKFQLGEVSPEVSIFYRLAIAAALLIGYCKIKGTDLRFKKEEHLFLFLLGASMFSIHYIFLYKATLHLVSGLVSVVFSLVTFFNVMNNFLFFRKKPEKHVVFGGALGLFGIVVLFWKTIFPVSFNEQILWSVFLVVISAMIFSLGNMVSYRNAKREMQLVPSTAMGMAYGAGIMLVYVLIQGLSFQLPHNVVYWTSLLYLAIPGSIIAFLCYLALIAQIGPEKAGYATIFFPMVALLLSILLENYLWSWSDLIGIVLILVGNYTIMCKKQKPILRGPS
jgi:drug/metabolite transporter (DMT)-like permease